MVNPMISTLDGRLDVLRHNQINLLTDIATALGELNIDAAEDQRRLMEVAQDLRDMFYLVVVIGEFNAGKSSFVNALIGAELLPVGVTPTTEAIELVRYSETPRRAPTLRGDSIREWAHPHTGGQGVAIVDTPGTGSVFQRHETTAKAFLHRSDLVIFVINAKRAFAETERIYLEMARDYGKKIILVVNQIDLLDESERSQVRRFIEQQVKELLQLQPLVFMVSSKLALQALQSNGDLSASGIDAVRAHLRGVFAESPLAKQKLLTQLDLGYSITRRNLDRLTEHTNVVMRDTSRVRDIQTELQQQSIGLSQQLIDARAEVEKVFEGIRQRGTNFINAHLSVNLLRNAPNREMLQQEFQEVVIGRALRDVNEATNSYVNAVVDHSRLYWRGVIDRLNQLNDLLESEVSGLDASVYAQQRESLQEAIRIAENELKSYSSGQIVGDLRADFEDGLNGLKTSLLASLGALAIFIIAATVPGIAAAPAAVISAPFTLYFGWQAVRSYQRATRQVRDDFNKRLDQLSRTYFDALDDLTQKERERLTRYGTQMLMPIFSRLEALSQRYNNHVETMRGYLTRTETLRKQIEDVN